MDRERGKGGGGKARHGVRGREVGQLEEQRLKVKGSF